jgi:hypothetical protein
MCTDFSSYFSDKLVRIRETISTVLLIIAPFSLHVRLHSGCQLSALQPAAPAEVAKITKLYLPNLLHWTLYP